MNKIFFIVLLAIIAGVAFTSRNFKQKVGDLRPAIFPSSNKATSYDDDLPFVLPEGFKIHIFAKDLGRPRDLEFSEGGTLLTSVPSKGVIVALPDKNTDGRADEVKTIVNNLDNPHGLAFSNGKLFVAEEKRVSRYSWNENTQTATLEKKLFDLPKGGRHTTRTLDIDKSGKLFISLGSTCDVCFEKHPWISSIVVSDVDGTTPRIFAKGLRNSVFITLHPQTDRLWGTEMGRDFLGDNLPPDEINILTDGRDYGWPVCYGNQVYDKNFGQRDSSYCNTTTAPAFNLPAHVAPLGLTFIDSTDWPKEWQGNLLVALHGSWNSSVPVGYKVVRLDVEGEKVTRMEDFITGFLQGKKALARPADVIFDKEGSLYVSDDKGGMVFKVTNTQ